MSAKWMRIETDFVDHPKTRRLASELGDPLAGWYVLRLWSWMSRFCPVGHVVGQWRDSLESACEWRGEPGRLVSAFIAAGFLDTTEEGDLEAHGWAEHQGKVAARARKEAERKRLYRSNLSRGTGTGQTRDVPRDKVRRPAQRDVTGRDVEVPRDARHAPLVKSLVEASPGYTFSPRDAKAVSRLLEMGEPPEVLTRWRRALAHEGYPRVRNIYELPDRWNDFRTDSVKSDPNAGLEKPTRFLE
jgi:hypothetical protein